MPASDVSLPIDSSENVTFTCNVSQNESERQAIWEVGGRQIQGAVAETFERVGIFVEGTNQTGVANLIVTSGARVVFQDSGIMIACAAFTLDPPATEVGGPLFIRTYGKYFEVCQYFSYFCF